MATLLKVLNNLPIPNRRGVLHFASELRALKPSGDVDPVPHQVPVFLLDHVAEMDADAILDALFWRQARVALDQAVLHLDCAAHRVDDATELDDAAVACALDDAAMMYRNGWIDQSLRSVRSLTRIRSSSARASRE